MTCSFRVLTATARAGFPGSEFLVDQPVDEAFLGCAGQGAAGFEQGIVAAGLDEAVDVVPADLILQDPTASVTHSRYFSSRSRRGGSALLDLLESLNDAVSVSAGSGSDEHGADRARTRLSTHACPDRAPPWLAWRPGSCSSH